MTKTEREIKDYIGSYDDGERMLMVGASKETGERIVCVWDCWKEDMAHAIIDEATAKEIIGKVEREERITITLDRSFIGQKFIAPFEPYEYEWQMCKRIELISDAANSDVIISLPNGEVCGCYWTFEPSDVELWHYGIKEFEPEHKFRVYQKTGVKTPRFDGGMEYDDSIEMDGDGFRDVTANELGESSECAAKRWDFDFLDCEGEWQVCIEYYPPRDEGYECLDLHPVAEKHISRRMYEGN